MIVKNILILIAIATIIGCQKHECKNNKMNNTKIIQNTVTSLFVNTDNKNWDAVEKQFASKVNLDYSSMTGKPAVEISPKEITTSWKTVLPGFEFTHHQIANWLTKTNGDTADLFCYGTATHYLKDDNGNVWTVVGSYDFKLKKINGTWKITSMKFNYKYQDGNLKLVEKAIENAK